MAGSHTCHSLQDNSPLTSKDELAGGVIEVSTNGSGTLSPILTASCVSTFALPLVSPENTYTNLYLQKTTKLAPDFFIEGQAYAPRLAKPQEKSFKACFPDFF